MKRIFHRAADVFLRKTRLCYWPVRVKSGVAAGARWTLYPWSAYWRGGFENELQLELIRLGDITGWCCWDLGAHYGLYSVGLARRTGPSGAVVSLEPNPLSFARLERHRRMNALTWLKPIEAAVSDAPGTVEFYTYGALESTTTHLPYEGETRDVTCAPVTVRLLRLDDLVASGEIRAPHFVKIDVEGHAHKALAGARSTLAAAPPSSSWPSTANWKSPEFTPSSILSAIRPPASPLTPATPMALARLPRFARFLHIFGDFSAGARAQLVAST